MMRARIADDLQEAAVPRQHLEAVRPGDGSGPVGWLPPFTPVRLVDRRQRGHPPPVLNLRPSYLVMSSVHRYAACSPAADPRRSTAPACVRRAPSAAAARCRTPSTARSPAAPPCRRPTRAGRPPRTSTTATAARMNTLSMHRRRPSIEHRMPAARSPAAAPTVFAARNARPLLLPLRSACAIIGIQRDRSTPHRTLDHPGGQLHRQRLRLRLREGG